MTEKTPRPVTCMDTEYDPNIFTFDQASAHIDQCIKRLQSVEQVPIQSALDRVLASDITSPIDVPPYDNSAMDGYAIVAADIPESGEQRLKNVATVMAGKPYTGTIEQGQCARIMTGGKMPVGADTVVMQELVNVDGDTIFIGSGHHKGDHVRNAGDDITAGQLILQQGHKLSPADIGLLASLGIPEIKVYRKIRVAFFSTGDELKPLGSILQEGQIYDSNRYTLFAMLSHMGAETLDMGAIADDRTAIETAFQIASTNADVLITTGGVSVGEADFVKEILSEHGKIEFWKLAVKPGKPLAFGRINDCWFFGLPGNPVSAMVTFYQLVLPALRKLSGQSKLEHLTIKLRCMSKLKKTPGRLEFQRGVMAKNSTGEFVVTGTGSQGSHVLSSVSKANCFIVLPLEWGDVDIGTEVEVQPFLGLI